MKITKRTVNHPSKVFWYCKVCKERREGWKSRQNIQHIPFVHRNVESLFTQNMPLITKDIKPSLQKIDLKFGYIIK